MTVKREKHSATPLHPHGWRASLFPKNRSRTVCAIWTVILTPPPSSVRFCGSHRTLRPEVTLMPYTIDPSSADCYPCTSVLVNKFDLRSQQELDRVEAVLVTAKAAQWKNLPCALPSTLSITRPSTAIFSATSTNGPVYPVASTSPKRVRSSAPQMRSHASALLFSGGWPSRISSKAFPSTICRRLR